MTADLRLPFIPRPSLSRKKQQEVEPMTTATYRKNRSRLAVVASAPEVHDQRELKHAHDEIAPVTARERKAPQEHE